jgi:hypothetical protein
MRRLLDAYAANNPDAVIDVIDRERFTLFGSDVSEIVRSETELRSMMRDDFALWRTAAFGEMRDQSVWVDDSVATQMFHVGLSVGGRAEVLIRVTAVWHKRAGTWKLVQSSNTVPTVGSSARELLQRGPR